MKNLNIIAFLSVMGGAAFLNAGVVDIVAKLKVNTVVNSCASQRGNVECAAVIESKSALEKGQAGGAMGAILGSIGEFEKVTIPVTNAKQFGSINKATPFAVENIAPASPDVIAYTPTTGKLAGKEVYVAFKKVIKKAGTTQKFDKVDIYARLAEKSGDQWFNAGEIIGTKDGVAAQAFTIQTDGALTTAEPNVTDIALSELL